jgi:transcriptional/translational regulatory protein YebC/TACO1
MAGHSHASNVKHKKDRNDRLKSETFLKLRKKIESILLLQKGEDYDKVFALARENNFPKEKVNAIIEKIRTKQNQNNVFSRFLYKSSFDII